MVETLDNGKPIRETLAADIPLYYLDKLIGFQDTEPVKIVTGIRRCGKSSLLKLMIRHLLETGITSEQIVEMNFESFTFRNMDAEALYDYVKARIIPGKRMYLLFDELQCVSAWEEAVNGFRVDFDCDIYITGSNAYLLSSEYATYLALRYVEIRMLPLSFREFLYFHQFQTKKQKDIFGMKREQAFDKYGQNYDLQELLAAYIHFGGMPGLADAGLDQEKARVMLDGIYSTVVFRDIMERERRKGKRRITDASLSYWKAMSFMKSNASTSRVNNIYARWANITLSTWDFEIICWVSETGIRVICWKISFISNCYAVDMMWQSAR